MDMIANVSTTGVDAVSSIMGGLMLTIFVLFSIGLIIALVYYYIVNTICDEPISCCDDELNTPVVVDDHKPETEDVICNIRHKSRFLGNKQHRKNL